MKRAFRRFTQWLIRLLLRAGLLPASTKADTDTMGEWKRLMAEKDDPKPGLVLPDPKAPHAALIRRVRLYAQNGAKALAPLLDKPLPALMDPVHERVSPDGIEHALLGCRSLADGDSDRETEMLVDDLAVLPTDALAAIHAAYNAPWTVVDGEVYEYESEKKRRAVQ
jgi:hypothetical protein